MLNLVNESALHTDITTLSYNTLYDCKLIGMQQLPTHRRLYAQAYDEAVAIALLMLCTQTFSADSYWTVIDEEEIYPEPQGILLQLVVPGYRPLSENKKIVSCTLMLSGQFLPDKTHVEVEGSESVYRLQLGSTLMFGSAEPQTLEVRKNRQGQEFLEPVFGRHQRSWQFTQPWRYVEPECAQDAQGYVIEQALFEHSQLGAPTSQL